jgi:hypothetical protein
MKMRQMNINQMIHNIKGEVMYTQKIIENILSNDLKGAREITHTILSAKLTEKINDAYDEIAPTVFGEAKKAPVTDKDDDGEGMDPVGAEDDDIDNDGDSDSSDKYLKNRRKVVTKAVKQDEQVGRASAGRQRGGETTFGVRKTEFKRADPEERSRIKQRHYANKERQTRDMEAERKRNQRERERKQRERGMNV